MSRSRLAARKHFAYKPNLQKIAAYRRTRQKHIQRKKKRMKKKSKSKNNRRSKKRDQHKKKKIPHSKQMSRRFKFARYYKGKNRRFCQYSNKSSLCFGRWGFKILKTSKLNSKLIFAAKEILMRIAKGKKKNKRRYIRFWDYTLSDVPVTKKPDEIRMGKGKGQVKFWITRTVFGKVLFELNQVKKKKAIRAFKRFGKLISKPFVIVSCRLNKWKKKFKLI